MVNDCPCEPIISHNTETTHWLDPRLMRVMSHDPLECDDNGKFCCYHYINHLLSFPDLPYGWEKVIDPIYGEYYIE